MKNGTCGNIRNSIESIAIYPNVDCIVHDLACKLGPRCQRDDIFPQIKTYAVDRFHATKHKETCIHSPYNNEDIAVRLKDVNTSVSEQTFSWFKNYAASTNELKTLRHKFLILVFCKKQNDLIEKNNISHLIKYSKKHI